MMRTLRVLVVSALMVAGTVALAPGATAAAPSATPSCKSLNSLNDKLQKVLTDSGAGKVDTGAIGSLSTSFRNAAKHAPASLQASMKEVADVAATVSHTGSTAEAAAAVKSAGVKFSTALATWGGYVSKHCPATTTATT